MKSLSFPNAECRRPKDHGPEIIIGNGFCNINCRMRQECLRGMAAIDKEAPQGRQSSSCRLLEAIGQDQRKMIDAGLPTAVYRSANLRRRPSPSTLKVVTASLLWLQTYMYCPEGSILKLRG
jgi:hypothetical protein